MTTAMLGRPSPEIIGGARRSGLDVRILDGTTKRRTSLRIQPYPDTRLHVRAMIRDGRRAFVGSQSLRRLELEGRREVGLLFQDRRVVKQMLEVFEGDWARTNLARQNARSATYRTTIIFLVLLTSPAVSRYR